MSELIVPVYLNQRLVFDLVAMLQGGISTVSRLEVRSADEHKERTQLETKFSLADAFSALLKIDLGGTKEGEQSHASQRTESTERTHTPASLFAMLRANLDARELLMNPEQRAPIAGDFVEFKAAMRRNPLIEGLDQAAQLLSMAEMFNQSQSSNSQKGKNRVVSAESELSIIEKQMRSINERLKEGNTRDLFATGVAGRYSAVVTVENQFLNDTAMTDLIDGTFSVVGKVIRVVNEGSISLLRNSSVSMSPLIVTKLIEAFTNLQSQPGFKTSEMTHEIQGPAFQVLPIAIFS